MLWACKHRDGLAHNVKRYVNVSGRYRMEVSFKYVFAAIITQYPCRKCTVSSHGPDVPQNDQLMWAQDDLEIHKEEFEKLGYVERKAIVARKPFVVRYVLPAESFRTGTQLVHLQAIPERL